MAYDPITAAEVAAKAPVDDAFGGSVKGNFDYLKSSISDGVSAAQTIDTNKVIAQSLSGFGLDVKNDAIVRNDLTVTNDLTVNGSLNAAAFFKSDDLQNFLEWGT